MNLRSLASLMRQILSIALLLIATICQAQNLGAFNDRFGYFHVFDNGIKVKLEQLPTEDFVVGGNAIGYLDNMTNFNIYWNGKSQEVADQAYTAMRGSQNLLAFNMGSLLYVFDDGVSQKLSNWAVVWEFIGEDIIGFWDEFEHEYRIYYNGQIHSVFNDLGTVEFSPINLGDCVIGYYDTENFYTAVYKSETYQLRHQIDVMSTKASRNVIGVASSLSPAFSVFHEGNFYELESAFPPTSFEVGIDMCAYVDNVGEFKVYYNHDLQTVASFEPGFYTIKDSIMVFSEQGFFKVWYNGEVTELENFIPESYQIDNGSVAYLDQQNRLKLFRRGEIIEVSNEIVKGYNLSGNVLVYKVGLENYQVFFKDLTFE